MGVVTTMDLLSRGAQAPDLRSLMRPATYVPETKRIDELLREMQKSRVQLAVVVDEYGGAVGIVTVEDIVEEIVGEIRDEHDRTPDTVERLPDGSYRVAGRAGIDEVNEALDWDLPKGDFETVAGPRARHPAPHPPGRRGVPGRALHLHGARGRHAPRPHRPRHPRPTQEARPRQARTLTLARSTRIVRLDAASAKHGVRV